MNAQKIKNVLPLLLAAGLWVGTAGTVFAEVQAAVHEQHQTVGAGHAAEAAPAAHGKDAHAGGEAAHGEGHAAPMVTKEKLLDLLWRTLNFAALVFILVKFAGKPVTEFMGRRRHDIERDLREMQAKRDETERACKEFEARLAGMEGEIELIIQRAVALAEEERSQILAEAEEAGREIRRQAEAAVQAAEADIRSRLREEVAEQAARMAEQLIVRNLTPADHAAIIEQYLEKAGAQQ